MSLEAKLRHSSYASVALATALVLGAAPARASASTISATEGSQISGAVVSGCSRTTEPTLAIQWGDLASSEGTFKPSGAEVAGAHTYAEEGTYSGKVTGCVGEPSFTANVADAPLTASPAILSATAGLGFTETVATFTDADPQGTASDYTATIEWGDGSASAGTVSATGGGFQVGASHTYAAAGGYTASVTIADRGGSRSTIHAGVAVASSPPPHAHFSSVTLERGVVHTPGFAEWLFDASSSRPPTEAVKSFSWTVGGHRVALCDGSTSQLRTSFLAPGAYTVGMTVTDSSGAASSASQTIDVAAPPSRGKNARVARVARSGHLNVIHTEQVFTCERGPSDPTARIVSPSAVPTPGSGCQTQVEAGIVDATGCLSEHLDGVVIEHEHYVPRKGKHAGKEEALYQLKIPQKLEGVGEAEAKALLDRIARRYEKSCGTISECETVEGFEEYEPQGLGGENQPPNPELPHAGLNPRAVQASGPHIRPGNVIENSTLLTPCSATPSESEGIPTSACLELYVSQEPVLVNGLDFVPEKGAEIVVAPQFNLVISTDAKIDVGNLEAQSAREVIYELPASLQEPSQGVQALEVSNLPELLKRQPQARDEFGSAGGFPTAPNSSLHVAFTESYTATVNFQVELPKIFSDGHGNPATVKVYGLLNNTQGLQIVYGYLKGLTLNFGPVGIENFSVCFRHQQSADNSIDPCPEITHIEDAPEYGEDFWTITGTVKLGPVSVPFQGKPPAGCEGIKKLGIGFNSAGGFNLKFAALGVTGLNATIFKLLTLESIYGGFEARASYDKAVGCFVGNALGGLIGLSGEVLVVWVPQEGSYTFASTDLPDLGLAGSVLTEHLGFGVGGRLSLKLPSVGEVPFADAYFLYVDKPSALLFGGGTEFSIPFGSSYEHPPDTGIAFKTSIKGGVGFESLPPPFFLEGFMGVKAQAPLGNNLNGSLQGIVSDDGKGHGGIAVCGEASGHIFGWGFGPITAGFGYHWGDNVESLIEHDIHLGGGCGESWYTEFHVNVQSAAAAGGRVVHVPRGAHVVDLYLSGRGGAPDVTITGPGGVRASTAGTSLTEATTIDGVLLGRMPAGDQSLLVLLHPRAGAYRITPNPGSPSLGQLREAVAVSPHASGSVLGRGTHKRLRYRIGAEPRQTVTFIERFKGGVRILGNARSIHGSVAFLASPGRGRRQIIAQFYEDGIPAATTPVTSYAAPAFAHLPRVRVLRVRRAGARATISFRGVGAHAYEIYVELTDGTRLTYVTSAHRLSVGPFFLSVGGRVLVRAAGDGVYSSDGPPATATLRPAVNVRKKRRHPR